MKLTGQCKTEFQKWLIKWIKKNVAWETETPKQIDIDHFYSFPNSMQYGVLIDYFDSVGIYVDSRHNPIGRTFYYRIETIPMQDDIVGKMETSRPQAREKAIKKAVAIRNKQLK